MRVIDNRGLVYDSRYIYHAAGSDPKYALPNLKKYPLPNRAHVKSAIKFFNYVSPRYEKVLAYAILKRMREYGMSFDDMTIGDENRFKKYISKREYLAHHGIMGMHWGIRRYQPYPDGYRGDGKFVGKSDAEYDAEEKKARAAYKVQKASYRSAKKDYKETKRAYKDLRNTVKDSEQNVRDAHEGVKQSRIDLKEAKAYYKDRKKFGSYEQEQEAKAALKSAKASVEDAKNKLMREQKIRDVMQTKLNDASSILDQAKAKKKLERRLLSEAQRKYSEASEMNDPYERSIREMELERDGRNAAKQIKKDADQGRRDAINDVSEKIKIDPSFLGGKGIVSKRNLAYYTRNPNDDTQKSLYTTIIKKMGGMSASKAYRDSYSKAYDEAIKKAEGVEFKDNVNKQKILDNARNTKPEFRRQKSERASAYAKSLRSSGMTYAEIAKKLGVSESTVRYYLE